MDLEITGWEGVETELIWLRVDKSGRLMWKWQWSFRFHTTRKVSYLSHELL